MITKQDVVKIASLSKVKLDDAASEKMVHDLNRILGFVDKLNEINVDGVEATLHAIDGHNVFRVDEAQASSVLEKVMKEAPSTEDNFFTVPRVI
jgi:aspartyl-tRNA(Asn)/glutamyl-tRNA(Gln) amidotransferase subunit C